MTDDPIGRLEQRGALPAPPPDADFADRLESKLRVDHVHHQQKPTRWLLGVSPRLVVGVVALVAGAIGAAALIAGGDDGVPVQVVDEGSRDPGVVAAPGDGGSGTGDVTDRSGAAVPSAGADPAESPAATPTSTVEAAEATPTQTPGPNPPVEPTPTTIAAPQTPTEVAPAPTSPRATPSPTPSLTPTSTPTSGVATPDLVPSPTNTAEPTAAPIATPVPLPAATATPIPPATPTPAPTPTSTPEPTPTPTVTPSPIVIDLSCQARVAGDAVGVSCSWTHPRTDGVTSYVVLRSRNGSQATVVTTQRATAPATFVDRDVAAGDSIAYLVRAMAGDRVIGASVRVVVQIPN